MKVKYIYAILIFHIFISVVLVVSLGLLHYQTGYSFLTSAGIESLDKNSWEFFSDLGVAYHFYLPISFLLTIIYVSLLAKQKDDKRIYLLSIFNALALVVLIFQRLFFMPTFFACVLVGMPYLIGALLSRAAFFHFFAGICVMILWYLRLSNFFYIWGYTN
jgi:hypothetical protein